MSKRSGTTGRMGPDVVPVSREQVLAYRAAAHELEVPASDPTRCVVLGAGVQDTPAGTTARLALRARSTASAAAELADGIGSEAFALVHSVRGTMHLHRTADVPVFAAALRLDDAAELAVYAHGPFFAELAGHGIGFTGALDEVAAAMRAVMADGRRRTKGELSGAIVPTVDERLAPWCGGCGAHHVHDGLFRLATLQAGLHLVSDATPTRVRFAVAPGPPAGQAGAYHSKDDTRARRELVRRFLRTTGPATPDELAGWLGLTTAAAGDLLSTFSGDLAAVNVEGRRAWVHADDLEDVLSAPPPVGTRLLPPYDPVTEIAHREFLVPDRARRSEVWRAAANPGTLLVRGDVAGTWRQRTSGKRLTLTVRPFRTLTEPEHRAVSAEAEGVARCRGLERVDVRYD